MVGFIMQPSELIKWRKAHGLTQAELALMLGVASNTVYRWEAGTRTIPPFLRVTLKCLDLEKGGEAKVRGQARRKRKR
jgi:transcriptional regulator with XRE-family HTH domain